MSLNVPCYILHAIHLLSTLQNFGHSSFFTLFVTVHTNYIVARLYIYREWQSNTSSSYDTKQELIFKRIFILEIFVYAVYYIVDYVFVAHSLLKTKRKALCRIQSQYIGAYKQKSLIVSLVLLYFLTN